MKKSDFNSLCDLYRRMDDSWSRAADAYGFKCTGCEDNCCRSLFFHHTFVEKAYFLKGFDSLDPEIKKNILHRAEQYYKKTFQTEGLPQSHKIMCPANEEGRCILYGYRPMICRLHGLPHELTRPEGETIKGPGCDAGGFGKKSYRKFDRTPFYQAMAQIEMAYRRENGIAGRINECIAQMLLSESETDLK